jgi:hypothetical protein
LKILKERTYLIVSYALFVFEGVLTVCHESY